MFSPNSFLFPPPDSIFVSAMSIASFTSLAITGASEMVGKHLGYSKFSDAAAGGLALNQMKISSRTGMLLLYAPSMAYALAALFSFSGLVDGVRARLVAAALAVHFGKRVFEVLFIHHYSGQMILHSAISIFLSYFSATFTAIYAQYLAQNIPEPAMDFKYAGVLLFLIGIFGNFYHHYLLSKLRVKGEKAYKIPKGGLFSWVICPHYLFEIIGFIGISFIAQTVYVFSFTLGSIIYLIGRSYVTRQWYLNKFDDFPKQVLFIHHYSGQMILHSAISIFLSCFSSTFTTIYAQYLAQNMPEPAMDFKYAGVVLFLIGISGNFYHHYLLSKLRVKGEKSYKIPKGGLFAWVICPHYLFEIIGFIGISFISQTVYVFSFTLGSIIYLIGRSYVTRQWYLNKFDDFPKQVKALIPYVF